MKSDIVIPIAAAVITALASIAGLVYSQSASLSLERYKFEQMKAEEVRKLRAAALTDFAKEFATAYQRAAYVIWQVEMTSNELRAEDFNLYQKETKEHMPKLVAAQIALATHGKQLFDQVQGSLKEYYSLDERISIAGKQFRHSKEAGLRALAEDVKNINEFEARMTRSLADAGDSLAVTESAAK
jgi:hypothetical protein